MDDYDYQAKLALAKHDYKTARVALKKIVELYPESAYAKAAQKALDGIVPVAVQYFKQQGTKYFHPEKQFHVPQTKAGIFFQKMYEADNNGPEAGFALYYWARSLGTEGKVKQEITLLQKLLRDFTHDSVRVKAMYLLGFTYCNYPLGNYDKGIPLLLQVAKDFPNDAEAPEALWNAAFVLESTGDYQKALPLLQQLKKHYPKSKRAKWADKKIKVYTEKQK